MTKKEILKELERIWDLNPDLRLGQLISNSIIPEMIYYMENDNLIECMKEYKREVEK